MRSASDLAKAARDCLEAAKLLAERFPVQSMELMERSVVTALRSCCAAEGISFGDRDDLDLMVRFVPKEAWATVRSEKVERLVESCRAWLESGRTDGDFKTALHADMETAEGFVSDAEAYLGGDRIEKAEAATRKAAERLGSRCVFDEASPEAPSP